MKTREQYDRRMSFAEGSILFFLIFGATLFLGVQVASHRDPQLGRTPRTDDPQIAAQDSSAAEPLEESPGSDDAIDAQALRAGEVPAEFVPATYQDGERAYRDGDYPGAAILFNAYTMAQPVNPWGYYMLGLSAWKAGDPETAEDAFLSALEIQPDHVKSLVNYGRVLLEMGRADEAAVQIERALVLAPDDLQAGRVLGRVRHNQNLLPEAEDAYRRVLQSNPQDVWSLNNLGLVLIQQQRFAEALPALAKAALLQGRTACIQNNLGIALEHTGRLQAAAEAYARAADLSGDHATAALNLARVQALPRSADQQADQPQFDLAAAAAAFTTKTMEFAASAADPADHQPTAIETLAALAAEPAAEPAPDPADDKSDAPDEQNR